MIASAKGASTDTSKDHEFTDWKDLEVFVDAFLAHVAEHTGPSGKTPEKHSFVAEESELFARDKKASEHRTSANSSKEG